MRYFLRNKSSGEITLVSCIADVRSFLWGRAIKDWEIYMSPYWFDVFTPDLGWLERFLLFRQKQLTLPDDQITDNKDIL